MQEMSVIEMQEVSGAGGKIDPGGYGDVVPRVTRPIDVGAGDSVSALGGRNLPGGYGD